MGVSEHRDSTSRPPTIDSPTAPIDVVLLGRQFGLPFGMAATTRVTLLCRALAYAGDNVSILVTQVSEYPPDVRNTQCRGSVGGIPFEYTNGTTVRAASFLMRRLVEWRGIAVAIRRLASLRRSRRPVAILAYMDTSQWSLAYLVLTASARALRMPVVLQLCELPWTMKGRPRPWERMLSPLVFTNGAVTISRHLTDWANAQYASRKSRAGATQVPILVDADEVRASPYPQTTQSAVYAVSSAYDRDLAFVLEAMQHVWDSQPRCRLMVTGIAPLELERHLKALGFDAPEAHNVEGLGWISRDDLLQLYTGSSVCLAPLFDDERSIARFPTKIGEYLAAARPVVTSSIGEVARYLEDATTAYLAAPGDAPAFGRKIVEVLSDPEHAAAVGARGRQLAEQQFDYRVHASKLHEALSRASSGRTW